MGSIGHSFVPEDVTVPMSRISEYLRRSQEVSKKYGLPILNFGHAGDGNFHPNVLYDSSDQDQVARLEPILFDLHKLACDLGVFTISILVFGVRTFSTASGLRMKPSSKLVGT